jgi:UDP-glucose 4-epimerase
MSNLSGAKVLVTGGAGFIGSELVRQLAKAGATVLAVDNLVNGKRENLAGLDSASVRLIVEDIRAGETMQALMRGVNLIFHLACLGVRHSIHAPRENHDVNATATLDLLRAARATGVGVFVCVSSSEVYGTARWVPMTENHPTFPMTVYGAGKLAAECYARAYWETYRYPTVIVRPFNAYGPRCHHEGDAGEVIPKFMLRAMAGRPLVVFGDGTQSRDFTYVEDTASGILQAGFSADAIGRTINIGSGKEISIAELARSILRIAGQGDAAIAYGAPRPGDVLRLCGESRLAQELCSYEPRVGLAEGLQRLLDWYKGFPVEALLAQEINRNWTGNAMVADA